MQSQKDCDFKARRISWRQNNGFSGHGEWYTLEESSDFDVRAKALNERHLNILHWVEFSKLALSELKKGRDQNMESEPTPILSMNQLPKMFDPDTDLHSFHAYAVLGETATAQEQAECIEILTRFQKHVRATQDGQITMELLAYFAQLPTEEAIMIVANKAKDIAQAEITVV